MSVVKCYRWVCRDCKVQVLSGEEHTCYESPKRYELSEGKKIKHTKLRQAVSQVEVTRYKLECIAQDVIDIVMRKNADYGDAWQKQGGAGWAVRLSDKLCRIENLSDGREALVLDESIDTTLEDAIGYCLLGLLYRKEMRHGDD